MEKFQIRTLEQLGSSTDKLLADLPYGLLLLDAKANIRYCNHALFHLLGIQGDDLTFSMLETLFPGSDFLRYVRQWLTQPALSLPMMPYTLVLHEKMLHARFQKIEFEFSPCLLLAFEDRHERRPILLPDRRKADKFNLVVDNVKDYAIFTLDLDGRIDSWNPGVEAIFGYPEREFVGRPATLIFTPKDVENGAPAWEMETARREGRADDERWHLKKDGSCFWANGVLTALRGPDSQLCGYVKILRDLTANRQTEVALSIAEQRFHILVDSVQDYAIIMLDSEGKVITWNQGAERILGYAERNILGSHIACIHPTENRAAMTQMLHKARQEGRVSEEGIRYRADGGSLWVYEVITPLKDERGEIRAFMDIIHDISERKRVDEHIQQLNADLEKRVMQRTAELRSVNQELEAFCYSVSHDLRAPLRAVDGFSHALLEDYGDKLDEAGKKHLERVRFASHRMAQLIDDLLDLSRISRSDMHRADVNLTRLAMRLAEDLQATAPERHAEFVIAPDLHTHGDYRLLKIVLENLLGNAWKFTNKRDCARIEFGCEEIDGHATYFVRDNGAGFDMNYVNKLFTPFQRLHGSDEFEGTGVGLATVQRVIHRHGGKIWAEGSIGGGATFYFTVDE